MCSTRPRKHWEVEIVSQVNWTTNDLDTDRDEPLCPGAPPSGSTTRDYMRRRAAILKGNGRISEITLSHPRHIHGLADQRPSSRSSARAVRRSAVSSPSVKA